MTTSKTGLFFKTNSVFGSLLFTAMYILSRHSSENARFGSSLKPSTAKSRRFARLSRDLRFVCKLAVSLANDLVCRYCPVKPGPLQVSRIFRIHILLNFEILFLEDYRFQNLDGLEALKEYALN